MLKRTVLIVAFLLIILMSYAKDPIRFGKVSMEEMEMTSYAYDTSAAVVVLCKFGYFNATEFTFTLTRRVKILKKSGVDYSMFSFPGNSKSLVRAKVYHLEDGKIISENVKNESIFKDRVYGDRYRIKVALPNVKVGTVYDIQYTVNSLPDEFAFQEKVPIKLSELILEESEFINFRKRMVGYESVKQLDKYTFVSTYVPAFKEEAYINSAENYITKFEFDLLSITVPGVVYKNFATKWEDVSDYLMEDEDFGGAIHKGGGYLSEMEESITNKCSTPEEKLEAAYEAVKKIKWNKHKTIWTSTTALSSVFKDGEANSADINFILIQLLKKLDIETHPVVLSTRDNGILNQFFPSIDKLNYVIVQAKINDKEYLMDATADLLPLGMLPIRCLNFSGRMIIDEKTGSWIDLKSDKTDNELIVYSLTLNEDLTLEGQVSCTKQDYKAYDFRMDYRDYSSQNEYLESVENSNQGLRIINCKIDNIDSIKLPIKENYDVKIKNFVQSSGDMIIINPFLYEQISENPFKLEKRNYPVDFAYKREKMLITKIIIPESYTISELPKPVKIKLPDNTGNVLINYTSLGNILNVTYKFQINKTLFLPNEYDLLKQFYAVIIEKQSEPVILKKNENEAAL